MARSQIFHGVKTNLLSTTSLTITSISTAIIGIVATADDADAAVFPLDTPVAITDVRAAISSAGATGTLAIALAAIADQCLPTVVVVRVDADAAQQDALVCGTVHGGYTGVHALQIAELRTGVKPRIIAAPGLESQAVITALAVTAKALRGVAYATVPATSRDAAIAFADGFGQRELMLLWPNATGTYSAALAVGLRAQIDQATGWHKTISNVVLAGVSGLDHDITWVLDGGSSDATLLNNARITTLISRNGWRFWGNRTVSSDDTYSFESAVRTSQVLQDSIDEACFAFTDQPLTQPLIETILSEIRKYLDKLKPKQLIGFTVWYDASANDPSDLNNGQLAISYNFTAVAPLEGQTYNQTITDKYYVDFNKLGSASS
jgi:phage tail sheath protein FI